MHELSSCPDVTFLLVDDHELCRIGMRRLIEKRVGWRVVAETDSASEAERLVEDLRPHVAIVDLRLKEGDGLELIRALRGGFPALKILVCSVGDERMFADACLHSGALGYVGKGAPPGAFSSAILKVISGDVYLSGDMADRHVLHHAGGQAAKHPHDSFTPRERDVYRMIGAGQSVKQIARSLGISAKTVEYHRQQLKRKLQLSSSAALARHAMTHPLAESEEPKSAAS